MPETYDGTLQDGLRQFSVKREFVVEALKVLGTMEGRPIQGANDARGPKSVHEWIRLMHHISAPRNDIAEYHTIQLEMYDLYDSPDDELVRWLTLNMPTQAFEVVSSACD